MSLILSLVAFLIGQVPSDPRMVKANAAKAKLDDLIRNLNSSTSVTKIARDTIKAKTGQDIADANPYFRLDFPKLLNCIVAAEAQGARPELLLALWMKEGGTEVLGEFTFSSPTVHNADDAKALFIAWHLYRFMGADELTKYQRTAGDNEIQLDGAAAPGHRDALTQGSLGLTTLGVAKFDYATEMRDNLQVSPSGPPFVVNAIEEFHAASLAIQHALFEKTRTQRDSLFDEFSLTYPLSNTLAYLIYNSGRGGKKLKKGAYAILKATAPRAAAVGMSLEDFLLTSKLIESQWGQPRRNLIRFDHYIRSYAPLFA